MNEYKKFLKCLGINSRIMVADSGEEYQELGLQPKELE